MLAAANQKKTTKKNTSKTNTGSSSKRNTAKGTTAKKGSTAKRKKKNHKKEQMDRAMIREAILLAASAVAILFLLCNFGLCGKFGNMLSALMFGLFGITAYIFPVLLFLGVLFWVSNMGSTKAKIKLISAVIVYLAVCAVMQQISFPYEKDTGLMEYYTFSAEKHQGGGWIGALLGHLFVPFIGELGMHIFMTALILAGVVLITEKSFVGGVKKQGSRVMRAAEDTHRRTEVRRNRQAEKQQQIRIQKKGKHTGSAAIFTLEEDSISPEIQGTEEEEFYREQEENRKDLPKQQAEESFYSTIYSEQTEDRESFNQEQQTEKVLREQEDKKEAEDILLNPLETFTERVLEKDMQDMTIYQDVMAEAEIEVDIPPEMVPFPIAGKEYDVFEREEIEPPLEKRNEFYIDQEKNDIFSQKEGWDILETSFLTKQEKEEGQVSVSEPKFEIKSDEIVSDIPETVIESTAGFERTEEETAVSKETEESAGMRLDIDITEELPMEEELSAAEYQFPPFSLLKEGTHHLSSQKQREENQRVAKKLESTLRSFGVGVTVTDVTSGPTVTRYELLPDQGVKVSRIVGLADDIKLSLAAADIRIEAPIPGKSAVGIEVPNKEVAIVMLRDLLESESFQRHSSQLAFAVGKDIEGQTIVTDIAKMPHALIAGATGSGKSVCINTLIISILYKAHPEDVKLIMIDPKVVELSIYNGIPHLLIPVVTDPKNAANALNWAVSEMTDRYTKFSEWNVRNIQGYNEKVELLKEEAIQKMPQIVIIIDELADLMMVASNEVEEAICRLAQLARAAGIHLIIATQRPSVNVITGLIKANVPSRIAFAVSSGVDSRTILDTVGAEKLLGRGDMLFAPYGASSPTRIQGAFVSDSEVTAVVEFLKGQKEFITKNIAESQVFSAISAGIEGDGTGAGRDDYFIEAGRLILQSEKASIGMLQRKFKIGFNRAARIMDQLADAGVVGPEEGTRPRKIRMTLEEFEDII